MKKEHATGLILQAQDRILILPLRNKNMHSETRHAGDFGNIIADDYGVAKFSFIDYTLSFKGDNSVIGRSVIVHEKEDDLKTDPSGN